ncbi:MAG: VCBS repeat-containing protein, partial [Bacteroidota bacterium]
MLTSHILVNHSRIPYQFVLLAYGLCMSCFACQKADANTTHNQALFSRIPVARSGINFRNEVQENFQNFFARFNYVYNGGGVAVGDVNGDDLPDIYFTGNEVDNRLYLNQGNFQFQDITQSAGVAGTKGWANGVVMVDVNQDGHLDIYISKGGWESSAEERANQLFINQGDNTFLDQAENFGLADTAYSMQASFFDMDNDNDLDMYLTNRPENFFLSADQVIAGKDSPDDRYRDKLYENRNGHFVEIGLQAGITQNFGAA